MGAASCDVPAIVVTGRPMLNGKHKGKDIGAGTIVWQMHESYKAGNISLDEFLSAEAGMSRSAGTCNTMGTASTMACMAKRWAPRCRTTPPSRPWTHAVMCWRTCRGMRAVEMVAKTCACPKC